MKSILALFLAFGLASLAVATPYQSPIGILVTEDVPTNGTNEVQTLTFSALGAGTYELGFRGKTAVLTLTGSEANNAAISTKVDAALESMSTVGTGNVSVSTTGTDPRVSSVTFGGSLAKFDVPQITATKLTGTPTIAAATSTPGVTADGRDASKGRLLVNKGAGTLYINQSSTAYQPSWVLVGPTE